MQYIKKCFYIIPIVPLIIYGFSSRKNVLNETSIFPTYDEAMLAYTNPKSSSIDNNKYWRYLTNLYEKHIRQEPSYQKKPRIPKKIHQIWLDTEFPEEYKPLQQSVIDMHPDWQYKLWTNSDLATFHLENQDAFDAATNAGERADIFRYEILDRFGGVYLDSDFKCIKPLDKFIHLCDFFAGTDYYTKEPLIYNGLIGAAPGDQIIRRCIETLKPRTRNLQGLKLFFDIHKRTGPLHLTICFFKSMKTYTKRAVIFPATFFYPWPSLDRKNNKPSHIDSYIRPETHAIHYWGISWLDGEIPKY